MGSSGQEPGQLDQFLYTGCDLYVEDLTRYRRNGFHPIILGDILPKPGACVGNLKREPRYRVLLKLGYGAFGTVWLARDLVNSRYVSLKICTGTDIPNLGREATILSKLHGAREEKLGRERIIQLLDVFTIKGPNGFHECLVTEVIAPLSEPDIMRLCSLEAVYQILEGFAFLHGEGIAHGDPHLGNFGIALPQLEKFDENDIAEYFANPEIIPVIPRDALFPLRSLPQYVTPSASIASFLKSKKALPAEPSMSIKIFDFGRAHETNEKIDALPGGVPLMVRPPEVVVFDRSEGKIGSTWSTSADIWAIGCIIYKIKSGADLVSTSGSLSDFLLRAVQLGGPPPDTWPDIQSPDNGHANGDPPKSLPSRDETWNRHEASLHSSWDFQEKRDSFIDLVKKMVVTKPYERSTAAEMLRHPVFCGRDRRDSRGLA
ncbi:hypothetical protein V2A60_000001 [Cordyceps javanica]